MAQLVGPDIQDYRPVAGAVAESRSVVRLVTCLQNDNLEPDSVEAAGLLEQHKPLVPAVVGLVGNASLLAGQVEVERTLLALGIQDILGD